MELELVLVQGKESIEFGLRKLISYLVANLNDNVVVSAFGGT